MNPNGIPAFPRTFKDLQVADRYLRLKWADEAAGTDGPEYHCEDRDACAYCHGGIIVGESCLGGLLHRVGLRKTDHVPENPLVSTTQADKKKRCVDKTSSSWEFLAT
jgi:hypothetical protein